MNDVPHRPQVKTRKALTPLLEIRNLTKSFDGQHAVDDVSLTIYKGEILPCWARQVVENRPCYGCWPVLNRRAADKLCSTASIWRMFRRISVRLI